MVRGLQDPKVEAIINIKLVDNDADTYKYETFTIILARW